MEVLESQMGKKRPEGVAVARVAFRTLHVYSLFAFKIKQTITLLLHWGNFMFKHIELHCHIYSLCQAPPWGLPALPG